MRSSGIPYTFQPVTMHHLHRHIQTEKNILCFIALDEVPGSLSSKELTWHPLLHLLVKDILINEKFPCVVMTYALQWHRGDENMEKTATLNLRISPEVKKSAETVLSRLGVPMSTAIDIFLKQVTLTGGIPFAITLPKAPDSINADMMSATQIRSKLEEGLADIDNGKTRPAREAFEQFRKERSHEAL
jgi:addiction module RelB/DinJ family antitoxin